MREEAVLFGKTNSLVGIMSDPPEKRRRNNFPAMMLLNCGLLHRVGPQRLYVKMARQLAAMGFVCLRFDFSGIGDSQERVDHLPLEGSAVSETQGAMDWLSAARGIEQFILIGICAGGVHSFKTACCDPRVVGIVLINVPFGDNDKGVKSRVVARFYWKKAIFNPNSWLKVIKGEANYRNIIRVIGNQLKNIFPHNRKASSEENEIVTDLRLLIERGLKLLLIYSEGDYSLDYLDVVFGNAINEMRSCGKLRVEMIPQADHLFTLLWSQNRMLKVICDWAHAMELN